MFIKIINKNLLKNMSNVSFIFYYLWVFQSFSPIPPFSFTHWRVYLWVLTLFIRDLSHYLCSDSNLFDLHPVLLIAHHQDRDRSPSHLYLNHCYLNPNYRQSCFLFHSHLWSFQYHYCFYSYVYNSYHDETLYSIYQSDFLSLISLYILKLNS